VLVCVKLGLVVFFTLHYVSYDYFPPLYDTLSYFNFGWVRLVSFGLV
jgi:hypothetical protein